MLFYYIDSRIFVRPEEKEIEEATSQLRKWKHNLEFNREIEDYLEVNFKQKEDRSIKLTQLHLT